MERAEHSEPLSSSGLVGLSSLVSEMADSALEAAGAQAAAAEGGGEDGDEDEADFLWRTNGNHPTPGEWRFLGRGLQCAEWV